MVSNELDRVCSTQLAPTCKLAVNLQVQKLCVSVATGNIFFLDRSKNLGTECAFR